MKHPYKRAPESIVLYVRQSGSLDLMTGRSLPSFQQLYSQQVDDLRSEVDQLKSSISPVGMLDDF